MPDAPDDAALRRILQSMRMVAVIGVSANTIRPSYFVARYLGLRGKRVIPVNPGLAGQVLLGEPVVATVAECPPEVDTIDIFRRSEHVLPIVIEAMTALPNLKTVWLQIGVFSPEAQAICAERGVNFIQNRCPKIEYQRLFGELRMGGFNTGVISSKL
nr:CoA-binding protein [Pararhodobacter sp.]